MRKLSKKQILARNEMAELIAKRKTEIEDIKNNKIYENAFEWRFEFPEVLNDGGDFIGFDMIIGNPPYGTLISEKTKPYFKETYLSVQGPFEAYKFFLERGVVLLKSKGFLCYISPDTWINLSYFKKIRKIIAHEFQLLICSQTLYDVFDEATVDTNIYVVQKTETSNNKVFQIIDNNLMQIGEGTIDSDENDTIINLKVKPALIGKIEKNTFPLSHVIEVWRGMSAYGASNPERPYNSVSKDTEFHKPMLNGGDIGKYNIKWNGEYIKYGEWLHRPRPYHIYDRPHVLVQRIRNPRLKERIIATYDDEKFISSDGLSNLMLKDETGDINYLKFILAILNSKLINYWFAFYHFDVNIKRNN